MSNNNIIIIMLIISDNDFFSCTCQWTRANTRRPASSLMKHNEWRMTSHVTSQTPTQYLSHLHYLSNQDIQPKLVNSLLDLFATHAALPFVSNHGLPRHEQRHDLEEHDVDDEHVHAVPLGLPPPGNIIIARGKQAQRLMETLEQIQWTVHKLSVVKQE